jgi:hypothetical protein
MSDYRLFLFNRYGHITGSCVISADTDHHAIQIARSFKHPHKKELWLLAKLIEVFEPDEPGR